MPRRRLKDLPVHPLYRNLDIPEVEPDVLHRPLERMPDFMRVSLKTLSDIIPIDIGCFAHRHRRLLVIDKYTVAELKDRQYERSLGGPLSGFLYCYSYEANLVAGHFTEKHEQGMLWWYKQWETHDFLPEVKIGETGRDDFQERLLEQFTGSVAAVGKPQRAILLFLMYSPKVKGKQGLERKVQENLKSKGCWLGSGNLDDPSPGKEWFEISAGEAYSVATEYNQEIFMESEMNAQLTE
jgi:hypothetical protein